MTLHIIMLAILIIGGLACAWWLHRAYQERRKRQRYEAGRERARRRIAGIEMRGRVFKEKLDAEIDRMREETAQRLVAKLEEQEAT